MMLGRQVKYRNQWARAKIFLNWLVSEHVVHESHFGKFISKQVSFTAQPFW